VYSGARLLADLKFQGISGQYKNCTLKAPADFEFMINLIGPKIEKKDIITYRATVPVEERLAAALRFWLRANRTPACNTFSIFRNKRTEQVQMTQ
jgi:hypothetical protein